jgi:hypothetical protein
MTVPRIAVAMAAALAGQGLWGPRERSRGQRTTQEERP